MGQYGTPPFYVGQFEIVCKESMNYLYMPIKLANRASVVYPPRMRCFIPLLNAAFDDYGRGELFGKHVYVTVKHQYVSAECPGNRPGWHSDGFGTDDVNYIWSDNNPTVFNYSEFKLTQDDTISMVEMQEQARPQLEGTFPNYSLLRLNEFNIHKVEINTPGWRTFVKISISKDRYDLAGNTHNYGLDYAWPMKARSVLRNVPQTKISK